MTARTTWDGELSDGTVTLTRLVRADAADHFAGEDAELVRWLNGGPGSLGGVQDYLVRVEQDWAGTGDPIFHLAIRAAAPAGSTTTRAATTQSAVSGAATGRSATGGSVRAAAGELGVLMGTLDLQLGQTSTRPGQANLAYGLYAPFRGHGFASRAVRLGLRFLGEQTDVTSAVIRTHPDNHASAAVATRTGFRPVARAEDTDGMDRWERLVPR